MANRVRVEVWADVVCPWCAIGHAHLRQAIENSGVEAEVIHRAFQLDPHARSEPVADALKRRYGVGIDLTHMFRRVEDIASKQGLVFHLGNAISANTRKAHQLVLAAQRTGGGRQMMDALVDAHFTRGLDVSDAGVLREAAAKAGMKVEDVEEALADEGLAAQVLADQRRAQQLGIQGVPFFLVDGHGVSGAQPVHVLERLLTGA